MSPFLSTLFSGLDGSTPAVVTRAASKRKGHHVGRGDDICAFLISFSNYESPAKVCAKAKVVSNGTLLVSILTLLERSSILVKPGMEKTFKDTCG